MKKSLLFLILSMMLMSCQHNVDEDVVTRDGGKKYTSQYTGIYEEDQGYLHNEYLGHLQSVLVSSYPEYLRYDDIFHEWEVMVNPYEELTDEQRHEYYYLYKDLSFLIYHAGISDACHFIINYSVDDAYDSRLKYVLHDFVSHVDYSSTNYNDLAENIDRLFSLLPYDMTDEDIMDVKVMAAVARHSFVYWQDYARVNGLTYYPVMGSAIVDAIGTFFCQKYHVPEAGFVGAMCSELFEYIYNKLHRDDQFESFLPEYNLRSYDFEF